MNVTVTKSIVAVITTQPSRATGGVPVLVAKSRDEMAHMASLLENILDAMAHELAEDVMVLVRHR